MSSSSVALGLGHELVAQAAVERVGEVIGRESGERLDERGVAGHGCERISLEPQAGLEDARRLGRPRSLRRHAGSRDTGERLARQLEPVGHEAERVLPLGRVLETLEQLSRPEVRLVPVDRAIELDPHAVVEVALGTTQSLREPVGRIGGILPRRQRHDLHVEALRDRELHPAKRRVLSGRVGVEAEEEAPREPPELVELVLGERRAHRRDDRLEPRLAQGDHVGVPLHDHRALLLRDRRTGEVEPVEHVALLEQRALGGVHVLPAQRIVLEQLPRLEADHASAGISQRKHQPEREVVVATGVREPRRLGLVDA